MLPLPAAIKFTTLQLYDYNPHMTTKTPSKNGKFLGRPSKYDPAYCDAILDLGKEGLSKWQICSRLNIGIHNMNAWEGAHEDFRAALEQARLDALAYWEDLAHYHIREAPGGVKLNTGLWSRSMAARFPEQYRENSKLEVTGKNDGPVQVDVVHDFSQDLLDDLLATRQADAKPSKGK